MSKYRYTIEMEGPSGWFVALSDGGLEYCRGYMTAAREKAPRLPHRLRRDDTSTPLLHPGQSVPADAGTVLDEIGGLDTPSMMVAGYPTGQQLIRGAVSLLERMRHTPENYATDEERERAGRALGVLR